MTKGKWEYDGEDLILCDGKIITDFRPCNAEGELLDNIIFNTQEMQDNAELIALAGNLSQKYNLEAIPELVEAATAIFLDVCHGRNASTFDISRLESALKKAEAV